MDLRYLYNRVRQYGIKSTARRISDKWRQQLGDYPGSITVEIMTQCNLRCRHCRVTYYADVIKKVRRGFMDLETFKELTYRLSGFIRAASTFQFSTVEPLLHPRLFEMMDHVSAYNRTISFPLLSNGMLLTARNIEQLLKRNVPSISISLDGCTKETVESFKTGVDFNRVIQNIKLLKDKAGEKIFLSAVFVATSHNLHELIEYIKLCHSLGMKQILINGFLSFLPEFSHLYLYRRNGNPSVYKVFDEAYLLAKTLGIEVLFPGLTPRPAGCIMYSTMFVSEKGDVSPCVYLAYDVPLELFGSSAVPGPLVYGNLLTQDPQSIWWNDEFRLFRSRLRKHILPKECIHCADGYGIICSRRRIKPWS